MLEQVEIFKNLARIAFVRCNCAVAFPPECVTVFTGEAGLHSPAEARLRCTKYWGLCDEDIVLNHM